MADFVDTDERLRDWEQKALSDFHKGLSDAPVLYRPSGYVKDFAGTPAASMTFLVSEETPDRNGDLIQVAGWDFGNFEKNPVLMFSHDYFQPPVGTVSRVWVEGNQVLATVKWDESDDFAKFLKGKYERGIMRAVSVGFRPLEFDQGPNGVIFKKQELIEISAVPVPMHPLALRKALLSPWLWGRSYSLPTIPQSPAFIVKGVIGWRSAHPDGTPAADREAEWDAGREVAEADVEDLRIMCAWVDSENRELKTAYKFPHHRAAGDHPVVFRACAAVMAILNGGRGGADIPDGDREGVHRHIAQHMRDQFDAEPPELRSAEGQELKAILQALQNWNKAEKGG